MQQRSVETHKRILKSAQQLFAQNGYDASSVDEICRAASVSKGAFYHHFPTKQAVFLELLESWLAALDAKLNAALKTAEDVPQGLLDMAAMVQKVIGSADGRLPMFLEFWTQASRDPIIWQATVAPYRRYQSLFADIIKNGIAEGSLAPVDPDLAARVLVAMGVGLILQGLLDPQGAAWDQVTQQGVKLFIDGLKRRLK